MKINRLLYGAVLASLLLVGCSSNETEPTDKKPDSKEIETEEGVSEKIIFGENDAAIQEAIATEEGVEKVELDSTSDGKSVFLDVYVASEEFVSSEALVEKYAPQLQVLHPEAKIDVVFAHGTNTIVYETVIEPKE